jgi:polyvinyl alcohol dehydrogenase (cytochrome)
VYFGSQAGKVYSLDARTGCVHWYFDAGAGVRAAIALTEIGTGAAARRVAIVADQRAVVRALDAAAGTVIWETRVDDFASARISGSPALYRGRLYVPVASNEEAQGAVASYECCKFRGKPGRSRRRDRQTSLEDLHRRRAEADQEERGRHSAVRAVGGADLVEPRDRSAAQRGLRDHGQQLHRSAERAQRRVRRVRSRHGKVLWARQTTAKDAYVAACRMVDKTNCADSNGPDFDFGASPILAELGGGKRALLAGQKSGVVYALDPDRGGEMLWQQRVGQGGSMGGVQWGSAADGTNVYVRGVRRSPDSGPERMGH